MTHTDDQVFASQDEIEEATMSPSLPNGHLLRPAGSGAAFLKVGDDELAIFCRGLGVLFAKDEANTRDSEEGTDGVEPCRLGDKDATSDKATRHKRYMRHMPEVDLPSQMLN
jgi:hypothetical protein